MMKIIEKKILWKRLTWKIMEKQYSEWAVWARESLTTWKETKQTQPRSQRHKNMVKFSVFLRPEFELYLHNDCLSHILTFTFSEKFSSFPSPFFFFSMDQIFFLLQILSSFAVCHKYKNYMQQIQKVVLRLVIVQLLPWPPLFATWWWWSGQPRGKHSYIAQKFIYATNLD